MTSPRVERTGRPFLARHLGLVLVMVTFALLGIIYSVTTPILEASDEAFHFAFVEHLGRGGALPVQYLDRVGPWRQEGSQPPLYYWLASLITRWVDTSDFQQVHRLNPHADLGVVNPDRNLNIVVHTPRERFPWRGTVLAVHLVRGLSVLMGMVTVVAGYALARAALPGDGAVALGAAALTAFNAQYLFISGSVNNDALVIMLCALALWLMVRAVSRPPTAAGWALLGVVLGLAALTKASAMGMFALAALLGAYHARRARSWRLLVEAGLLIGLPALAVSGWWFLRNWRLYGDPLGLNAFVAVAGRRHPVPTLGQLFAEWPGFVQSYWGLFGALNVPSPTWVYVLLSAVGLLGLLGAPLYVWRLHRSRRLDTAQGMRLLLVAAWPAVVFASLVRWSMMTMGSQGRLMFSALTALSLLMAMGLSALLPRRRAVLPALAGATMLVIAAVLPFRVIRPAYAAPAILSESEVAGLSPRVDVTFGDAIRLLSYTIDRQEAAPGDDVAVTFYWKCLEPMAEDWSVFLHLLDENDVIVAQRDMYPGQGTYPTSLWAPGEVFADTMVVALPPTVRTPAEARFAVGFYRYGEGSRLPVTAGTGQATGDLWRFGRLTLPRRVVDGVPNPLRIELEDGVTLVGYDLDRTAAHPGETLHLTLYWEARDQVSANYSVFTHVLGEEHRLWAQMDGWPQGGNAPTAAWAEGQVIPDPYTLTLAPDTPPGLWEVEIGMYDETGKRLGVLDPRGHVAGDRIVLGHVRIVPEP